MVGRPGIAPGVSWFQARRIAFFLAPVKNGDPEGIRTPDLLG